MRARTISISGSHHQMGRQHGFQVRSLRPSIAQAIGASLGQVVRAGRDSRFETLLQDTCELLEEVDASLLAMIRGQAEALDFQFDTLLRYNLTAYLCDALIASKSLDSEGCTTWAATGTATTNGQPILVKNRDNHLEGLSTQVVIEAAPTFGYSYTCSTTAGRAGVSVAGINTVGLAVADTHVRSSDLGPGLPDHALMMHILETHNCVSSAVEYLRSAPRLGRNNLILADAQGHVAVFEIGHHLYGLRETHDGTVVSTNHFVSSELRDRFVDIDPNSTENSLRRYDKVTRRLNNAFGQIDVPFAQRLMADHSGLLGSICRHPREGKDVATLSTSIFLPMQRKMLFCHGPPCQSRYYEWVIN